jgi:hypothetical protein
MSSYLPADLDAATPSQHTGLFTGRRALNGLTYGPQQYDMPLYIANSAAAIVLDPRTAQFTDVRVFTTGFATAFFIADSVYEYKTPSPMIRTTRLDPDEKGNVGFVSVNFPSREPSTPQTSQVRQTRTIIETTEPFIAQPGDEVLWEFHIFLPQPDGTITKTVLGIREPLRAGQLKIVRVRVGDSGAIESESPEVGVSVTLDWKPGTVFNPEI